MNAVHNYPWLTWTWILAIIARIQIGNQLGVLQMIEGICNSNFSTIDEKMAILIAKALHLISSERNERILYLFQMLIMHRPGKFRKIISFKNRKCFILALLDLRISFAQYLQLFDQSLGRSILPKSPSL